MAHINFPNKRIHVIRLHVEDNGQSDYSESTYTITDQMSDDVLPNDIFLIVQQEMMNSSHHIAITLFSGMPVSQKIKNKDLPDSLIQLQSYYNAGDQKVSLTEEGMIAVISNF